MIVKKKFVHDLYYENLMPRKIPEIFPIYGIFLIIHVVRWGCILNCFMPTYRIALKFRGSKFSRITCHSLNYFNENFDTCHAPPATWTVFQRMHTTASLMALFVYFNSEDGQ